MREGWKLRTFKKMMILRKAKQKAVKPKMGYDANPSTSGTERGRIEFGRRRLLALATAVGPSRRWTSGATVAAVMFVVVLVIVATTLYLTSDAHPGHAFHRP
jgi:hypothetical protein